MQKINLRELYPDVYKTDVFVDVAEEVVAAIRGQEQDDGLISYVQYVQNGCVYFTSAGLQEYIAKCTHRAKPVEKSATYRKLRSVRA